MRHIVLVLSLPASACGLSPPFMPPVAPAVLPVSLPLGSTAAQIPAAHAWNAASPAVSAHDAAQFRNQRSGKVDYPTGWQRAEHQLTDILESTSPFIAAPYDDADVSGDLSKAALLDYLEAVKPPPATFEKKAIVGSWRLEYTDNLNTDVRLHLEKHIEDPSLELSMVLSINEDGEMDRTALVSHSGDKSKLIFQRGLFRQVKSSPTFSVIEQDGANMTVEVSFASNDVIVFREGNDRHGTFDQLKNVNGVLEQQQRKTSVWKRIKQPSIELWRTRRPIALWRFGLANAVPRPRFARARIIDDVPTKILCFLVGLATSVGFSAWRIAVARCRKRVDVPKVHGFEICTAISPQEKFSVAASVGEYKAEASLCSNICMDSPPVSHKHASIQMRALRAPDQMFTDIEAAEVREGGIQHGARDHSTRAFSEPDHIAVETDSIVDHAAGMKEDSQSEVAGASIAKGSLAMAMLIDNFSGSFFSTFKMKPIVEPEEHAAKELVEVVDAGAGRGLGLRARTTVEQGRVLIDEAPLFVQGPQRACDDVAAFESLPAKQQAEILKLAGNPGELASETGFSGKQLEFLRLKRTNSIALPGGGSCLYATASRANHSCRPNASLRVCDNNRINVIALRRIRAGEEVLVSYLGEGELLRPRRRRQHLLQKTWRFQCDCSRCQAPDDTRGFPCPACKRGMVHPRSAIDESGEEVWSQCVACGVTPSAGHFAEIEAEWVRNLETLRRDCGPVTKQITMAMYDGLISAAASDASLTPSLNGHWIAAFLAGAAAEILRERGEGVAAARAAQLQRRFAMRVLGEFTATRVGAATLGIEAAAAELAGDKRAAVQLYDRAVYEVSLLPRNADVVLAELLRRRNKLLGDPVADTPVEDVTDSPRPTTPALNDFSAHGFKVVSQPRTAGLLSA